MVFGGLFTRRTSCCWLWEKWWEGVTDTPSCLHDSVGVITAMGLITFRPNLCLKTCCLLLLITHKCWKKIEMQGWSICLLCFCICHVHEREREYMQECLQYATFSSFSHLVVGTVKFGVSCTLSIEGFYFPHSLQHKCFWQPSILSVFFFIPQNTHSFKMLVSQSS